MIADDILQGLEEMISKNLPMSAEYWLEKSQQLLVLQGDETNSLYGLQKKVAQEKVKWIEQGKSVAEAKLRVEANDIYEQMLKQKAKVLRIEEFIRIGKIQAKMRQEEFKGYSL